MTNHTIPAAALALAATLTTNAAAQTDPANFDFVYNIGNVTPGSIFDITNADIPGTLTNAAQIGDDDGNGIPIGAFVTPAFLSGDILNSNTQLNLFNGGTIFPRFNAGPTDGTGSNTEVNITGGSVGFGFQANAGSTVNISGGTVADVFAANANSTVNISGGAVGAGLAAFDNSTVNISGGTIGLNTAANSGSTINISGGTVGRFLDANSGSTVNISAGSVGDFSDANFGSTVNISGGTVGSRFDALGGTVNISGGTIGDSFQAASASTVNISGGSIGDAFSAFAGSTTNLVGTSFFINGTELTNLSPGQPVTIDIRNVALTGTLADGAPFDFFLTDSFTGLTEFFDTNATLTVALVPAPGSAGALALLGLLASRRRRERDQ